ncbi:MAG: bis(5'-nucleosyl)-tetraphosphatase (symmetrical) YqeK, partial [Halanaerobiales bacterium]|nr:bis(5'-nucleosyl)-tetraphosphatase (symmetrical) YqeK [Halanaerobiales bacterium]
KKYNYNNKNKLILAAVLHDYAKKYSDNVLLDIVQNEDINVDYWEKKIPVILHAPVGAYLVEKQFGITDLEILDAIRYHVTGRPQMNLLEKIIFIADAIEQSREFNGVNKIREAAKESLNKSIVLICESILNYNINKKSLIHPNTLLTRNYYLKGEH